MQRRIIPRSKIDVSEALNNAHEDTVTAMKKSSWRRNHCGAGMHSFLNLGLENGKGSKKRPNSAN